MCDDELGVTGVLGLVVEELVVTRSVFLGKTRVLNGSVWFLARMVANTRMELHVEGIADELREAANGLVGAAETGMAARPVERILFWKMWEMGRPLFGAFLKRVGTGDVGETTERPRRSRRAAPRVCGS